MTNEYGREFMIETISKECLKTGYHVKLRNGQICIVLKDCDTISYGIQSFCLLDHFGTEPTQYADFFATSDNFTEDLCYIDYPEYDIMEIRSSYMCCTCFGKYDEDLPIVWQRGNNNYTMYRADFEIDTGTKYDKHTALLLAKNKEDAWDKFNELINPLLQYDESVYDPKIEEIQISKDSFVYIDLIKKDNETKEFITKKIKDNNYSFEVGV